MGLKIAAGVAVGGLLGFLWYRLVGCSSGSCPLTSRWWVTTLYGAASGTLIALSK
jgi:hypothetical protein